MPTLTIPDEDLESISRRLRRARGQMDGILRMIDERRDCADIVTQLAAVSKAVDRAGFAMIAAGLEQCIMDGEKQSDTRDRLEKMFMSLA